MYLWTRPIFITVHEPIMVYRYCGRPGGLYCHNIVIIYSGGKLWQHISSYFQSLPQTPVRTFIKGNTYHGKTCMEVSQNGSRIETFHKESSNVLISRNLNCDSKHDESESVSSQEQSFFELIQEYTSGPKAHLIESDHNLSSAALTLDNLCGNDEKSGNLEEMVISNENGKHHIDKENFNTGSNLPARTMSHSKDNQAFTTLINNNPTPDLLTHSPTLSYSWKMLDALPTHDLVKNAQQLLESVSETLMHSDIVVSRLECAKLSDEHIAAKKDLHSSEIESESKTVEIRALNIGAGDAGVGVLEDLNKQSTEQKRLSTRRRASNRKRSIKSLESRISSDDLLGGGARALSGSLDREWGCGPPRPRLPEGPVRCWAAQLLVCLDSLHRWGVTCRDLHPDNLLLGEKGQLLVTYMCQWKGVDSLPNPNAIRKLYAAPEVSGILPLTQAADWWSFGAILYELLTGRSLSVSHPGGIHSHTIIEVPDHVSENGKSLLEELLRHNPLERLGAGVNGAEELKSHPFFMGVEWQTVLDEGTAA